MGGYVFITLLPDNAFLIASLLNATQNFGMVVALLCQIAHDALHWPIFALVYALGALTLVGALAVFLLIPSPDDMKRHAKESGAGHSLGSGLRCAHDDGDPPEWSKGSCDCCTSSFKERLYGAYVIIRFMYSDTVWRFTFNAVALHLLQSTFAAQEYTYSEALMGHKRAVWLIEADAVVGAVAGTVVCVCLGALCDRLELSTSVGLNNVITLSWFALVCAQSLPVQALLELLLDTSQVMVLVMVARFAELHAPPQLFGTLNGFALTVMGGAQLVFGTAQLEWSNALLGDMAAPSEILNAVRAETAAWAFLVLVSAAALLLYWLRAPPPRAADVTIAAVDAASVASRGRLAEGQNLIPHSTRKQANG